MNHLKRDRRHRETYLFRPRLDGTMLTALMLALLVFGCAGERTLVERWDNEAWRPDHFRLTAFTGQRDGAQVSFSFHFEAEDHRRLLVQGSVMLDPRARLREGRWVEEGSEFSRSGQISAAHPDFLGGQGGPPSLGGQFTLSGPDGAVYRLNLRPVELIPPLGVR